MLITNPPKERYKRSSVFINLRINGMEKKLMIWETTSPEPINPKRRFPCRKSNILVAIPQKLIP